MTDVPPRVSEPSRRRNDVIAWLPALAWAAFLFVLSELPGTGLPRSAPGVDKVVHAALYAVLGLLCWRAVRRNPAGGAARAVLWSTVAATAYGAFDELHQRWTPHRSADLWDLVADAGGALIATTAAAAVVSLRRSRGLRGEGRG